MSTSGVQPAPVSVRRWGEGRAERTLPNCLRVVVNGGSAGGVEREVKRQRRCGTDRARVIRDQLTEILQEAPEAA